jgi:hypothetical protein
MKSKRDCDNMGSNDVDFLEPASRDIFYAWAIGVVVATLLAIYGSVCIRTQSAMLTGGTDTDLALGTSPSMECRDASAIAIGVTSIAFASLLHFHFFWSWRHRFLGYAQIGKVLSLIVATGGIIYFIFHFWWD